MCHTKRPPLQRETEGRPNQESRIFNEGSRASPTFDRDFPPLRPRQRQRLESNASATSSQNEWFRTTTSSRNLAPPAMAPPPIAVRATPKGKSGIDFLVKLIENMKASFEKEISEIRRRLPPLERQTYPPENPAQAPQQQCLQQYQLPPMPVYPWNTQYNPNSMY